MSEYFNNIHKILIIATRQIGDVLLVTPLIHSIKKAHPDCIIDVLGYENKCQMLEGNQDIRRVIQISEKPRFKEFTDLVKRIFHQYDLSITTLAGDKPHFYAWLAAKKRMGLIDKISWHTAWKRRSCQYWTLLDNVNTHTVLQNLKLLEPLNIPAIPNVIPPKAIDKPSLPKSRFAIVHPSPMWTYKEWTVAGWQAVVAHLLSKDLLVILTGANTEKDKKICSQINKQLACGKLINLAGRTHISELGYYLQSAEFFIGPDTSITHMAAATGCKTLALFGPSNVVKWGPFPANYLTLENPYVKKAFPWQQKNNVVIIQGKDKPCLPCYEEGCDKHKQSQSDCLKELDPADVIRAIDFML